MAAALRINASPGPRSSPHKGKSKSKDSHDGNNDKRNPSVMSDKYIHVHHYLDTGRWGTWFNDPTLKRGSGKRRLYFGTYETEYLAARAQDRAALKFKPYAVRPITRLNFAESDYVLDKELRDKLTHGQFRRLLMAESRRCYKRAEPSPCWRIFLEEEAAKGNIHLEYGNRSNRYHRKPRTFTEVLQEIVSKNEAVNSEEITEPIDEPVTTGEEEGTAYIAERTKRPSQPAPRQPAQEVTKELVEEDPAALPTRSLSARQVRRAAPVAAPPVLRGDAKSASLSAQQVHKATTKAAPPVLRRDTRNPSQSARPVPKGAPKAASPVRRKPSILKRVRRAEGEGRSALQTSQQRSVYLDRLEWGRTRGRSMRNFSNLSLPNAASTDEATVAADSKNSTLMAANFLSEVTSGTSGTSDGKVALGGDHTAVENPSKRIRLNIDLNREPEPSSRTAGAEASPHESDATGGNDDPEVSSVETLLLLKSGWLK